MGKSLTIMGMLEISWMNGSPYISGTELGKLLTEYHGKRVTITIEEGRTSRKMKGRRNP